MKGSGFCSAIARSLVDLHGGSGTVASSAANGRILFQFALLASPAACDSCVFRARTLRRPAEPQKLRVSSR